jgi:hypothetical protein
LVTQELRDSLIHSIFDVQLCRCVSA